MKENISNNFIKDLDEKYQIEREKNHIRNNDKDFACNIPLKVSLYGNINEDYIIRKGKLTRFLYAKNGCRVHFTDEDIVYMLLQIKNKTVMDTLIVNLVRAYNGSVRKYEIWIDGKEYEADGIFPVSCEQVFTNPQDVDITFDQLLVLMNLVLSKDQASNPLWPYKYDFFKHTLSKYISLIKHYYYMSSEAREYLLNMGYQVDEDIYFNYNTSNKRDEKRGFFIDFKKFEKSGVL